MEFSTEMSHAQHGSCDCKSIDDIVSNHRTDLIRFVLHGDEFVRVIALAAFIQTGGTAELGHVRREIELLAEFTDEIH